MLPHLVLLPGLYGTGKLFEPMLTAHDGPATVVPLPQDPDATLDSLVDHVRAALPDEDFLIVAESFSGPIGIALASTAPPRCVGLVLVATFCTFPLPFGARALRVLAPAMGGPPPRRLLDALLGGTPALMDQVQAAHREQSPAAMSARLRLLADLDVSEQLSRVHVPMLYLQATNDRIVPRRNLEEIRGIRKDVTAADVDGPHLLLQTKPRECLGHIDVWWVWQSNPNHDERRRTTK